MGARSDDDNKGSRVGGRLQSWHAGERDGGCHREKPNKSQYYTRKYIGLAAIAPSPARAGMRCVSVAECSLPTTVTLIHVRFSI